MTIILSIFVVTIIVGGIIYISSQNTFEEHKSRIINLYSSVLSDMNMDYRDNTIGVVNIVEISNSIKNFSNEIYVLQKTIGNKPLTEQKWLIDIIKEFTVHLHLWIERHASELKIVENTIKKIETQDIGEKGALELETRRLARYTQLLEQI